MSLGRVGGGRQGGGPGAWDEKERAAKGRRGEEVEEEEEGDAARGRGRGGYE